jgi:hypothetical protein
MAKHGQLGRRHPPERIMNSPDTPVSLESMTFHGQTGSDPSGPPTGRSAHFAQDTPETSSMAAGRLRRHSFQTTDPSRHGPHSQYFWTGSTLAPPSEIVFQSATLSTCVRPQLSQLCSQVSAFKFLAPRPGSRSHPFPTISVTSQVCTGTHPFAPPFSFGFSPLTCLSTRMIRATLDARLTLPSFFNAFAHVGPCPYSTSSIQARRADRLGASFY